jgi:hypothetical protein
LAIATKIGTVIFFIKEPGAKTPAETNHLQVY